MHVCFCINIVYMTNKPNKCTKGTTVSGRKDEKNTLNPTFSNKMLVCIVIMLTFAKQNNILSNKL